MVKGYKVFDKDWSCRGKQYSCPGIFEEDGELEMCEHGMHFCKVAADCFGYYNFDPENHVAEVIAHGTVLEDGNKCCTDKLEIVRELPWSDVLDIVNIGRDCTGIGNTGSYNAGTYNCGGFNSGNWNCGYANEGDWNTGKGNSGNCNSGNWNCGYANEGDWNTGKGNSGNCNSGNWNRGNRNSGDWNTTCFSNGCFNTAPQKIYLFDKPSDWTLDDWRYSEACRLMDWISRFKWVRPEYMTDKEKAAHPEYQVRDGYLKGLDASECAQIWWNGLSDHQRNIIKAIPNFDAEIFYECTGIKIDGGTPSNGN